MKINKEAFEFAKQLIEEGRYEPGDGDWSEHQPEEEKENEFIESNGWEQYAKWFLGIEEDSESSGEKDEKETYSFPYGDFEKVHKGGLIAVKQRAGQYEYKDIESAADDLIKLIEKMEEDNE